MASPAASKVAPVYHPTLADLNHQFISSPRAIASIPSFFVLNPVATVIKGGQVGTTYTEIISVQGGTAPYTFALSSGALPGGLSLNTSNGIISGTPTTSGTFLFSIRVTDANSFIGTQSFSIEIDSAATSSGNFGWVA